jgi:hypothetical protein
MAKKPCQHGDDPHDCISCEMLRRRPSKQRPAMPTDAHAALVSENEELRKEVYAARAYILESAPDDSREWSKDESLAEWIHHFGLDMEHAEELHQQAQLEELRKERDNWRKSLHRFLDAEIAKPENMTPQLMVNVIRAKELSNSALRIKVGELEAEVERQRHKDELVFALRSRVLTDQEMAEVKVQGVNLLIRPNTPYYQEEKDREFNELLLQQARLRAAER